MEQSNIELLSQLEKKIAGYRKQLEESGFKQNDEQWTDFVETISKYDQLLTELYLETMKEDPYARPELPEAEGTGAAVLLADENDTDISDSTKLKNVKSNPYYANGLLEKLSFKGMICKIYMNEEECLAARIKEAENVVKGMLEAGYNAYPNYNTTIRECATTSVFEESDNFLLSLNAPKDPFPYENNYTPLPVRVRDYLRVADWAYEGVKKDEVMPAGIRSLYFSELPDLFQKYYDRCSYQTKGYAILDPVHFHIWFGMEGDDTVLIGFAGTQLNNIETINADVQQFTGFYTMFYQMAIGAVALMLERYPSHNVRVIGHSLGGGLAQFSVAANIKETHGRLTGIGFNSAGLSSVTYSSIKPNLRLGKFYIKHYVTPYDFISPFGQFVGSKIQLPRNGKSLHGIVDIASCVEKYINTERTFREINMFIQCGLIKETKHDFPFSSMDIPCIIVDNMSALPNYWPISCAPEDIHKDGIWRKDMLDLFNIPFEWIDSLFSHWNSPLNAGVLTGINGNSYTMLNRLMIIMNWNTGDEDEPSNIRYWMDCKENIYFTALYGKYGIDTVGCKKLVRTLLEDFRDSHYLSADKFTKCNQKAIDNLNKAEKEEIEAWKTVLDEFLPSCGLPQLGDSFSENDFLLQYRKFKERRRILLKPEWLHAPYMTDDDKNVFFDEYRALVVEYGMKIYQCLKNKDAASVTITEDTFRQKVEQWFEGFRKAACTKA